MTPQEIAKSIADELREHPERWTQGASARDADGRFVASLDPCAVCWCLVGHFRKRPQGPEEDTLVASFGFDHFSDLTRWNDAAGRTADDVIALCDQVGS